MILDLERFTKEEEPYWQELEALLYKLEECGVKCITLEEVQRLHYLYRRAASDLSKVKSFAAEPEIARYLEALVARAYGNIHNSKGNNQQKRFCPWHWFTITFPCTFRRHLRAFHISLLITMLGAIFGAVIIKFDPPSKRVIFPAQFAHLYQSPQNRVAEEESATNDRLKDQKSQFAANLMQNNIRVSIFAMALGMTLGLGSAILLFYNGIILGAVIFEFFAAGSKTSIFVLAWLLPHGSVEIPAILLGGQAGFIIASAIIGWKSRSNLAMRLRTASNDIATIIGGIIILLIWAGIVEAFFSQYHAPIMPYWLKISFGTFQLLALILFLTFSGRSQENAETARLQSLTEVA